MGCLQDHVKSWVTPGVWMSVIMMSPKHLLITVMDRGTSHLGTRLWGCPSKLCPCSSSSFGSVCISCKTPPMPSHHTLWAAYIFFGSCQRSFVVLYVRIVTDLWLVRIFGCTRRWLWRPVVPFSMVHPLSGLRKHEDLGIWKEFWR